LQELTVDAFDMIGEPILFAQQLHEHASRVHRTVDLIRPLADALLAEDTEKIKTLQEQMSGIRDQVNQIKLSLYDQIKNMRFHSVGGYAFSQYLASQDKIADAAQDFAALLASRQTTIPRELHTDFQAFVAQIVNVCTQATTLAETLSAPPDATPPVVEAQNTAEAMQGVMDGNRRARQLGMKLAQCACRREQQLGAVTILFLDKFCAALYEAADNAEHTADHLRLMIR
jgi:predicted phosphate transport protein (TIGR00153 family)